MKPRTEEEERRGCRERSKLWDIALEVVAKFKAGMSYSEITADYAHMGITLGMVSGHINRNGIVRGEQTPEEIAQRREERRIADERHNEQKKARRETLKEALPKAQKKAVVAPKPKPAPREPSAPKTAPEPSLRLVVVDMRKGKKLIDMRSCQCWMTVGPEPATPADQQFCGARTDGGMFCEEHAEIAYRPKEERRRKAA